jgi:D-serine deaminase-like pyridoxal phosphate-dependent protein
MGAYSRYSRAFSGLRTPFAFVDLELFDRNAEALVKRASPFPIRVASKSIRCVELMKRVLSMPGFSGVLCYSGWEAVYLASQGLQDLVVAYPIVQKAEILAVIASIRAGAQISLMVDRLEHLEILNAAAVDASLVIPVVLDFDLANHWAFLFFGARRSWISSAERLSQILDQLTKCSALKLDGVMGYEAQIAGVSDRTPLYRFLKARAQSHVFQARGEWVKQVQARGHSLRFVNGGGTGSIESTKRDESVTEIAVGSGLFSPTLFDHYENFHHLPAAGFALSVTRKPETEIATCFSGGYVASGSAGNEKLPSPFLPEGLKLLPNEGAGEVQTPVSGAKDLKIGDFVFFRHAKAGEFCERFEELQLIEANGSLRHTPTYRGAGKNFG